MRGWVVQPGVPWRSQLYDELHRRIVRTRLLCRVGLHDELRRKQLFAELHLKRPELPFELRRWLLQSRLQRRGVFFDLSRRLLQLMASALTVGLAIPRQTRPA